MKEKKFNFKDHEDYRNYLDNGPQDDWLQRRSLGGGDIHLYIPIFIIEANADIVFNSWNIVSEEHQEISNGIMCTVRIEAVPDYPESQSIFFTGSAATQYKVKAKNHIEFDVPNAREKAIGKAFATLGNIFGRSLNRSYKINKGGQEVKQIIKRNFTFRTKEENDTTKKPK